MKEEEEKRRKQREAEQQQQQQLAGNSNISTDAQQPKVNPQLDPEEIKRLREMEKVWALFRKVLII